MQTCQRCYKIVNRACQSDTEAMDCKNLWPKSTIKELSPVATLMLTEYLLSRRNRYAEAPAVDSEGSPVDPLDQRACAWSIDGAICRITQAPISHPINARVKEILLRVAHNRGYHSIEEMRQMHYRRAVNTLREAVVVAGGH